MAQLAHPEPVMNPPYPSVAWGMKKAWDIDETYGNGSKGSLGEEN